MNSAVKIIGDWLRADGATIGITGQRIYPIVQPEDSVMPSITLHRLQTDPENILKGAAPLNANHVIVDCWCPEYQAALTLRDAVRACLETTNGLLLEQETEDYDPVVRIHRISQQWLIWT